MKFNLVLSWNYLHVSLVFTRGFQIYAISISKESNMGLLCMLYLQGCEGCNKQAAEDGKKSTWRRACVQGRKWRDIQALPNSSWSVELPAASCPGDGHSSAAPLVASTTRSSRACSHYSPRLDDQEFSSSVSLLSIHHNYEWSFVWHAFN